MTVSAAREEVGDALDTIAGLNVYREWTNNLTMPAGLVEAFNGVYGLTFEGGLDIQFGLLILVSGLNGPGDWMNLLDAYIEPEGASSVAKALRTAGYGLASFENPGKYDVYGKQYFGVHMTTQPVLI